MCKIASVFVCLVFALISSSAAEETVKLLDISDTEYSGDMVYFPEEKFMVDNIVYFSINYTSIILSLMKEPSLWELSTNSEKEIYRFILYNGSSYNYLCARIEIDKSGQSFLYVKILQLDYKGNYRITKIISDEVSILSENDILVLREKLAKANFWIIEPDSFPPDDFLNSDQPNWVFEGVKNGDYQAFEVNFPITPPSPEIAKINELAYAFLSLAKIKVDDLKK